MPASIVEGAQAAVAIAQDHYGIFADLHGQVVAGIQHFAVVPHEQPIAVPDHLQIDLVILRAAVEISFEGGFEIASPQSAQHGVARSHDGILILRRSYDTNIRLQTSAPKRRFLRNIRRPPGDRTRTAVRAPAGDIAGLWSP